MFHAWFTLGIFLLCYVLFVIFSQKRSIVACAGASALIVFGVIPWNKALFSMISWNVMGLFFGTLILAELFMISRVPAMLAEWLVTHTKSGKWAMLYLCILAGFISAFVENVAVVLLIAPVAVSVAKKLGTSPVPLLIGIAISSNLQGTATMIGDPPSMILAGYMKFGFLDFFFLEGKPSIFFAVQAGALASIFILSYIFRKEKQKIGTFEIEKVTTWIPSILLGILVIFLSISTLFDPSFKWFAGVITMALALIATIWYTAIIKWGNLKTLFGTLDWDTTFFLIGVFIIVGGLSETGWLDKTATYLGTMLGSNPLLAFCVVIALSVAISAFVDNVPFLLAMIPVIQKISVNMPEHEYALMFGLLIGACLGGNITPIGASANIVTLGLLRKQGYTVSFKYFISIGLPFTLVAVTAASLFVWLVW